jgi:hypothetical protein
MDGVSGGVGRGGAFGDAVGFDTLVDADGFADAEGFEALADGDAFGAFAAAVGLAGVVRIALPVDAAVTPRLRTRSISSSTSGQPGSALVR